MSGNYSKKFSWQIRWAGSFIIIFGSLAVISLVLEAALSFVLPSPNVWFDPQESYEFHPQLIHKLKANQSSFTHSAPVLTNSQGLRDYEFSLKPKPGVFRILCLGDSLTFGHGVNVEETYPKQLESVLNQPRQGKSYEVINAGVEAYDTWQELIYLRQYGLNFEPSLVLIGVYANDIDPQPTVVPRIVSETGDIADTWLKKHTSRKIIHLLKRSRLLLFLKDRWGKLMNRIHPSQEFINQSALLHGTNDSYVQMGFSEIDKSFAELSLLSKQHKFGLLLVVFPLPDQIVGEYPNAIYPSRVLQTAEKYSIPVIDLMPVFKKQYEGFGSLFIHWDGHPNATAYKIAAKEIQRYLDSNIIRARVGTSQNK